LNLIVHYRLQLVSRKHAYSKLICAEILIESIRVQEWVSNYYFQINSKAECMIA